MPNRKLSDLPTIEPINNSSTDLLYIVDVSTDRSKKITFNSLVGSTLNSLSAETKTTIDSFSAEFIDTTTTDFNFLSGVVNSNSSAITLLDGGSTEASTRIDALSDVIDVNFGILQTLSADVDTLDPTQQTIDIAFNLGQIKALTAETDDLYITTGYARTAYTYTTQVSATNLDKINTQVGLLSGLGLNSNTAATSTGDLSATHFFNINFNGVTYKMLLAT
jgi:hypothetical protein